MFLEAGGERDKKRPPATEPTLWLQARDTLVVQKCGATSGTRGGTRGSCVGIELAMQATGYVPFD